MFFKHLQRFSSPGLTQDGFQNIYQITFETEKQTYYNHITNFNKRFRKEIIPNIYEEIFMSFM